MELVIDISEEDFEIMKHNIAVDNPLCPLSEKEMVTIIANGTPLPKGHGDLIDRNELLRHYDSTTYHNGIEERKIHFVQIGYVNDAPTIIEADKEEDE